MKDDRKTEMKRHHTDIIDMQRCLRTLVHSARLPVTLEDDPEEPNNLDELSYALNVVRTNMNIVQMHLNDWDWHLNGPELRPKEVIQDHIKYDTYLLSKPDQHDGRRNRREIEANLAYDQMQIKRI